MKVIFAPGCFDDFEGTQEELEEFQASILKQFEDGTFFENSTPFSEIPEDEQEFVRNKIENAGRKTLQ